MGINRLSAGGFAQGTGNTGKGQIVQVSFSAVSYGVEQHVTIVHTRSERFLERGRGFVPFAILLIFIAFVPFCL